MHCNINSTATVKALLNYGNNMCRNILADEHEFQDKEKWVDVDPMMQSYGIPFAGDGSPTCTISSVVTNQNNILHQQQKDSLVVST